MSLVLAYKGHITVEGSSRQEDTDEVIYSKTVFAYGESLGELLDNLVQASVTIANDAFEWALLNRDEEYSPKQDYWYISFVHPDILPVRRVNKDVGSGSSISSFDDIVRHAALTRDIHINMVLGHLRLAKSSCATNLPEKATVPFNGIYEVTSFNEMTRFGFTGKELDSILRTAHEEGRLEGVSSARIHKKPEKATWWQQLLKK